MLKYQMDDMVPREVVRRIIDSGRTQEQMLEMLDAIPKQEKSDTPNTIK